MLLVLNLPLAKLLRIPAYGIYAGVLVFATLGTYAAGGTTADLLILCGLGLLGLLMREGGIPHGVGGGADGPQVTRGNPLIRPRAEHACRMLDY